MAVHRIPLCIAAPGIGLQVHGNRNDPEGSRAQFRNISILELPDYDVGTFVSDDRGMLSPTPAAAEQGWRKLFNGEDLAGWETVGGADGYRVEDGVLVFPVEGGGGYIRTAGDYRDFELRMDFKIAEMANSGVFLRGDREGGDPAYSGCPPDHSDCREPVGRSIRRVRTPRCPRAAGSR